MYESALYVILGLASTTTFVVALIFYHINIKSINFLSKCAEWCLFKRGFNKKMYNSVNAKIALVYVALVVEGYLFLIMFYILSYVSTIDYNDFYVELFGADTMEQENLFSYIFAFVIFTLGLRLIFEFIIIPIYMSNKQPQIYQTNVYTAQTEQQSGQTSITSETQIKFCSQCGTRYDAAKDNCPNCGMK